MSDCSICCETFNKSTRCKIECKTCEDNETNVCRTCAKRYILDQPTDASCMVCKVEWDQEALSNYFTKVFVNNELKKHRENYLFDKQVALLPETQEYAEQLKFIRALEKQKQILYTERRKIEEKLKELNNSIRSIDQTITRTRNNKNEEKTVSIFRYKCPMEDCNGFLNEKFYCGICENQICKDCMEKKEEDHECNEEKKETVKMLRKDTKPCPKCGEMINKSHGCDQMYCITCHTAFSWNTGKIERGTVHNPEYYRWMRENGRDIPRNPLDIVENPCNELIPYNYLLEILRRYHPPVKEKKYVRGYYQEHMVDHITTIKIINMHRLIIHIQANQRNYGYEERNIERNLKDMRALYILNELPKDEFKRKLQIIEKKKLKTKNLQDIWNVLMMVLNEYIGRIQENSLLPFEHGKELIHNTAVEAENVRKYCNNSFEKVGKLFNMTYPGINKDWVEIHNWKQYEKDLERLRNQEYL